MSLELLVVLPLILGAEFVKGWTDAPNAIATSIMRVGAVRRTRAVRWSVTRELALAWLLTFPICAAISWTAVKSILVVGRS